MQKQFHYWMVINNYFKYHHIVDDHNACYQFPFSIEKNLRNALEANLVCAFLLHVTEVNTYLAYIEFFQGFKFLYWSFEICWNMNSLTIFMFPKTLCQKQM